MLIQTLGAPRDVARLNEIAGVFIRHGLGDVLHRLGMADLLARAGHVLHWKQADELARLQPPEQLRRALEQLGPTFVKLGQILAGRADLFGPEWTAEFSRLHSHVPAVPLDTLRPQLREDLGGEPEAVFARFDADRRGRLLSRRSAPRQCLLPAGQPRRLHRLRHGRPCLALIIGSSIVMTVGGGPTLLGLPAFGLLGFGGAVAGGLWLMQSMWRGRHPKEEDDER